MLRLHAVDERDRSISNDRVWPFDHPTLRVVRGDGLDGDQQSVSSVSRGFKRIPRISATFLLMPQWPAQRLPF